MKEIKWTSGKHFAMEDGRIWSKPRRNTKWWFLKCWIWNHGYQRVNLKIDWVKKMYPVHRLIANTFIKKVHNKPFINHKNGIKHDNRVENLEWCTASENVLHWFKVLKREPSFKSVNMYSLNLDFIKSYTSLQEASKDIWICVSAISNCLQWRTLCAWKHIWKYT